jgi:CHAT domain
VTRDRPDGPGPSGFVEDPPGKPRARYLSASYPESIQPGRRFSLEATVGLSRGRGRTERRMRDFEVGPQGKRLRLTIYAPRLTVHGDQQLFLVVPPSGDSDPVRFDLEGTATGVQLIRLRAWEDGTCVGELDAEVTVSDRAPGGPGRTLTAMMEAEAAPGEITLEVSSEVINGQHRYCFQLQDPVTAPPRVFLPLREDPAADLEGLVLRMDELTEDLGRYTAGQRYRALAQEGKQLWRDLVPPAVQEQFWACRHRIGQLTIIADHDALPWELLYPWDGVNDAGFLVEQDFPVTRRVHGFPRRRLLRRNPARFVLAQAGLPKAEDEVNVLKQLLEAPEPTITTLLELQELLDEGAFGVLHFACHGSFSASDRGPQVDLDLPFMPRELVDAGATWQAPMIFLNACRSGGPRRRCTGLDSFAERFIQAKAGAFIGSLWEVRDRTAAEFATELYQSLLQEHTLGQAVTDLRKRARDGDPSWLAYAVYGDPRARLA